MYLKPVIIIAIAFILLIPTTVFAQNSDSSDISLSEISVVEFKSFIENQIIYLADSIRVNPLDQTISSLLFIGIGAFAGFLGSFGLIELQNYKFRNKIKSLINKDFNSLSSDLTSRLEPLEDVKKTLNEKITKEKNQGNIADVNIPEIISAKELKSKPRFFELIRDSGTLLKLSADEIAEVPPVMEKMIQLHHRCKSESESLSHSFDSGTTTINYFVCVKLEKKITELIEEIEAMKISCETLHHFKWLMKK